MGALDKPGKLFFICSNPTAPPTGGSKRTAKASARPPRAGRSADDV